MRTFRRFLQFIPKHSVLKFRLIDLLEGPEDYGSDILNRLSQIPLSYMRLSDSLVRQLRSVNVFPDDGFDGFSCCTLNYLTKLSSDDGWMDLLLSKWRGLVDDHLPGHGCRDISHLADRKQLLVSEFSIPRDLGHLPVGVVRLRKDTVDFLESVGIKKLFDLEEVSEGEILERTERIGYALNSLRDLYWAMQHKQQQGWNVLINFFDKPIDQFMMDHLRPANVNERDMCIFLMHKGLVNGEASTLEDIGERFGITRERIRQVVKSVTDSIDSSIERKRLNLSPLIDLIDSLVLDKGGVADPKHLSDRIEWEKRSPAESFLLFLEFLLETSPNIHMKNGIVIVWPNDKIDDLLRIVEQHLSECGEPLPIKDIQNMEPVVDYLKKADMKMSIEVLEKLARWNRRLGITPDGKMGLRKWKWAFPHTKKDRLYYVLKATGYPMYYPDAHAELRRMFPGQYSGDSRITLSAFQTYKDAFNLVDHGTYALKEWNVGTYVTVGNAIEGAMTKAGGALTYAEIRREVWGIRDCPESNIKVALGQKRFARVGSDRWDLAERLVSAEDLAKEDRLKRILEKVPTIRGSSNREVLETNRHKGIDGFKFLKSLKRNRK